MAYLGIVPPTEIDRLRDENAALRRRVETAERDIEVLRAEALARRAEVRTLAEQLPAAVSRRTLLTQLVHSASPANVVRSLRRRG